MEAYVHFHSNVLDRDLLQIFVPVLVEADFFLALSIEFTHDMVQTVLESRLKHGIVLVASLDYGLVMGCVLNLHLRCDFILHFVYYDRFGSAIWSGHDIITVETSGGAIDRTELLLKVNSENVGS